MWIVQAGGVDVTMGSISILAFNGFTLLHKAVFDVEKRKSGPVVMPGMMTAVPSVTIDDDVATSGKASLRESHESHVGLCDEAQVKLGGASTDDTKDAPSSTTNPPSCITLRCIFQILVSRWSHLLVHTAPSPAVHVRLPKDAQCHTCVATRATRSSQSIFHQRAVALTCLTFFVRI